MPHTDTQAEDAPSSGAVDGPATVDREACRLAAELRAAGLDVDEPAHGLGESLCGLSLCAAPCSPDEGYVARAALARRVERAQASRVPVTIDVSKVVGSAEEFEAFCHDLVRHGVRPSAAISLYCERPAISLRAFSLIACSCFGAGTRYVGLPDLSSVPESHWRYLFRRARSRWAVLPVYADFVAAASPLLCDEAASGLLPSNGLKVPQDSAWLPLRLNLPRFVDGRGRIDGRALEHALHTAVDAGEQLLDALRWSTATLCEDAHRNRRIALQVQGIGDLVCLQHANPGELALQRDLRELLQHIRTQLQSHSAALASRRGACPAIAAQNPALHTSDAERRRKWADRWQSALERCALRHRNLLTLSPAAVLPECPGKRAEWADLLPLLGMADSFSFVAARQPEYWNLSDFKAFHRRAAARIAHRSRTGVVATGV